MKNHALAELARLTRARAALDLEIADRLDELALEARPGSDGSTYTSDRLPPGIRCRATFARACRTIAGAALHGRTWVVQRAAWDASRRPRRVGRPASAPTTANASTVPTQTEQETAKGSGLRLLRA